MTIELLTNLSEKNRIKKNVTSVLTVTGNLKDDTSIVNPSFVIGGDFSQIANANYVYIPDFKRYYFITEMVQTAGNMTEITCHCDVLMSFSDNILNNDAVLSRQERVFNRYLNDPLFKVYQNSVTVTRKLSGSGFGEAGFILVTAGQSE